MDLTTRVTSRHGCALVTVDGELDLSTAEQLMQALTGALDEFDRPLVLDLAGLRFCDSAGLAVLVKTHNQLGERGHRLVVARPTAAVARVLELSGLDQVIVMAGDPDDACVTASAP